MNRLLNLLILIILFSGCDNDDDSANVDTDNTPPEMVTGLSVTFSDANQIDLSWLDSSDNRTASVNIIYEICQSQITNECDTFVTAYTSASGLTSYIVNGLNPLTNYYFKVRAIDEAGNTGNASDEVSVITNSLGTVSAPGFDPVANIYGSARDVTISSSTNLSTLCYTTDGSNPSCDAMAVCTGGAVSSSMVNVDLTQTVKAMGCKVGYTSSTVSIADYIIDPNPPGVPGGLSAVSAGDAQINLSWATATDDVSASGNLVYEICQSLTSNGCDTFNTNQTTASGVLSFSATALDPLTDYFFRIRARDEAGNLGNETSVVSATTNSLGTVNAPTFNPVGGTYDSAKDVVISSTTAGSTLCYTTDGVTTPSCNNASTCIVGNAYTTAVSVATSQTLESIACLTGYTDSIIVNADYSIITGGLQTVIDSTVNGALVDGTINVNEYIGSRSGINSGFGDIIGGSSKLYIDSNSSGQVQIGIEAGSPAAGLNDIIVIYVDSITGGFTNTGGFTDQADSLTKAVSGFDGTNRSTLTFAAGFEADYAIAIDNVGASIYGLINGGSHTLISNPALLPTGMANSGNWEVGIDLADISLASGDNFKFVASYITNTAFRSDEFIGVTNTTVISGNIGSSPIPLATDDYVIFVSISP